MEGRITLQNDYGIVKEHTPKYRFHRLLLDNIAGGSFNPTNTSQGLEWKIPPNTVYNLARSYISYNITFTKPTAKAIYTHEDVFSLAQDISFGTATNINLCDLKFASNYTKIVRKIDTKLQDYLTNDPEDQLYPCNILAEDNYVGNTDANVGSVNYIEHQYVNSNTAATAVSNFVNYP